MTKTEKDYWDQAKELLGNFEVTYVANWKFDFLNSPVGLLHHLSRCKFAMRMATRGRSVLELGCEIGIGASVLGEMATSYFGVDDVIKDIEIAKKNITDNKYTFVCDDFIGKKYGVFDSVIAFDVLKKVHPARLDLFFKGTLEQLAQDGILILGLSEGSQYHSGEIARKLRDSFHQVWVFGMSGEIVHTNQEKDYSILLCFQKK